MEPQHACARERVLQRAALSRTGRDQDPASRPVPQEPLQGLIKDLVPLSVAVQQQQNLAGPGQRRPQLVLHRNLFRRRKQSGYFLQQVTFDLAAVQMKQKADAAEVDGTGWGVRGPRGPGKGQELCYGRLPAPRRSLQEQGLSWFWHQSLQTDRLTPTDKHTA